MVKERYGNHFLVVVSTEEIVGFNDFADAGLLMALI